MGAELSISGAVEPVAAETAVQRISRNGVLIIAHRGDSKVAPENTLPAFASAVKSGADLVELDYFHSSDAVPVVLHDEDLDRTTNATLVYGDSKVKLVGKSLAELKTLDAGSWFDPRFAGTRIPTLAEALDTIQAGSMTLVEHKGGDPATCVGLLTQKKSLDRVVVQSFDWTFLEEIHRLAPTLVLTALGDETVTEDKLARISKTGASIVAWEDKNTSEDSIAAIHQRGWKAWVWTVDDAQRVRGLVDAKIDGIITNLPVQTRRVVEGMRPPL